MLFKDIQFSQIPTTYTFHSWWSQFCRIQKHRKPCAATVTILLTTDMKWMLGSTSTLAVVYETVSILAVVFETLGSPLTSAM